MKAAIYSRKSRFTGKGESIENQIQLCKEHAIKYLSLEEKDFIVYEDEGFSGGNTNRPKFQKMMLDGKDKKFNILICYRLDRISRNVSDFSNLIKDLKKSNIDFVSIREQFDTTTPMGRAMMYIASVFSQLERETIAERIKDNMIQLSKTGRWLGGTAPTGYESKPIVSVDENGKERKMFKLSPITEELNIINLIYNKFVNLKSITQVENYLVTSKIRTKNGFDFQRYSIRFILANPVYAIADKRMYDYLLENNYDVYSDSTSFNGIDGLIGYNKTLQDKEQKKNRYRESCEWIIAVGKHKGVIPSEVWIEAQKLLQQNKSKSYRKVKSTQALLSGILRCGSCGSYMRPKAVQRNNENGEQIFYYMCEMKERSKKSRCKIKNINGNIMDELVLNELKKIAAEHPPLVEEISFRRQLVQNTKDTLEIETKKIQKQISENEKGTENLVNAITKGQKEEVLNIMIKRMEEFTKENQFLNKRLLELSNINQDSELNKVNLELVSENLATLKDSTWELMDVNSRRSMIKSVVDKIIWDGKKINLMMFGSGKIEMPEKLLNGVE